MSTPEFVHLHVHSEYSLLDGLARIDPLVRAVKDSGMSAMALTDHGAMYGALDFYKTAKEQGIKPIIGIETYVAPRSMALREGKQDASGFHLVLLAENEVGYRNLVYLATEAQLRGYYYKPRIDRELLSKHTEGLIAMSACLSSEIGRALTRDDIEEAERTARWYAERFPGRYYLEIQDHGLDDQRKMTRGVVDLSRKLNLPLVASNDVHYIAQSNAYGHEVLLCVQTSTTMDDPKRMRMDSDQFYLKTPAEMAQRFSEFPEALRNTLEVAERCSLKLEFNRVQLPQVPIPDGYTMESYLHELCIRRLPDRFDDVTSEHTDRLAYELSVIEKTGFAAYFLLLEDLISFARRQGIMVGPGRGSAAGSIVAYVLGITDVDPLAHSLLFERFLNPERISMPDIDTDFADDRREEVIQYIIQRYGADHVAQISTFGTMAARAAVKDVGRALGMPYSDVDAVAKLIPQKPGHKVSIKSCLENVADMRQLYETRDDVRRLIDAAQQLEDVKRHASTHAAGVVISHEPLVNHVPLVRTSKDDDGGQATQYEFAILDKIGLLKMDILGLSTLTLIRRCIDLVERGRGMIIDPRDIRLDDPEIYQLLCTGETTGIFQLESGGMKKLLRDMQPSLFSDIVALISLYRPGSMDYIDDYIGRKHGTIPVTYFYPTLEDILKETYGILVYQEQVLLIARELAGFSWGQADVLRKAMGKKLPEEMKKQRDAFVEGARKKGIPDKIVQDIYALIEKFAGYGFNKSHAASYAVLSAQTAYLKAKFRVEFMAACLSIEQGNPDRTGVILSECRRLGVRILPPEINRSEIDFSVDDGAVRFALSAIRNVGASAMRSVLDEREQNGPFTSIEDFCTRVDWKALNKRALEGLIKAGAFDGLTDRATLVANVDRLAQFGQNARKAADAGLTPLFAAVDDLEPPRLMLAPAGETPRKQILKWEKEMLGLYLSEHPLTAFQTSLTQHNVVSLVSLTEEAVGRKIRVAVMVTMMRSIVTKKSDTMLALELEDLETSIEAVVFPRTYARTRALWAEDAILIVDATVDLRDDKLQLICEDAVLLEHKVSSGDQKLIVRFNRTGDNALDIQRVQKTYVLLQQFPGTDDVELTARDSTGSWRVIAPPSSLTVCCCPELLQKIAELLGPNCTQVERQARQVAELLSASA